jgi:predicted Zn-dependent peptidase
VRQRGTTDEMERPCRTARLDSLTASYEAALREQDRFTVSQPDRTAYMAAGATGLTASTGRDWMKYHADLPAHRLETFMWIERSRMDNPVFRQFDPEKQVVIEQIRRAFNRADAAFNRTMRSLTYEAHPYGWAHWFSDLEGATREDHWEIYYKHFTPQNTILVVVGAIEAEEVFRLSERYWGDWPPARASPRLRTVEPVPSGERRLTARAAAGPALALNVAAPAVGHPDQAPLEVLAELLGGRTGLLMRRLGDRQGLVTGASASIWTSKYPSHFGVHLPVRSNEDLPAAERELFATLEEIARGGVGEQEVRDAVRAMTFRFVASFDEPGDAAVTIGSYAAIEDWRLVNDLPRLWAAVTPADLARVASQYFAPDRRIVGVLERGPAAGPEPAAGNGGYDALAQARPGVWPAGGPVEEFLQPLDPRMPARSDTIFARDLPPLVDAAGGRWTAWGELRQPRAGEPLPVAENVWYVPPWMAVRAWHPGRPADSAAAASGGHPRSRRCRPSRRPPRPTTGIPAPAAMRAYLRSRPLRSRSCRPRCSIDVAAVDDPTGKEGLGRLAMETLMSRAGRRGIERRRAALPPRRTGRLAAQQQRRAPPRASTCSRRRRTRRKRWRCSGRWSRSGSTTTPLVARLRETGRDAGRPRGRRPHAGARRHLRRRALRPERTRCRSHPARASIESITRGGCERVSQPRARRCEAGARRVRRGRARTMCERWVAESFRALSAGTAPQRRGVAGAATER